MAPIPRKMFQTGPADLRGRPLEARLVEATRAFCAEHGFTHEYFDDDAMASFVAEEFPQWLPTFESLGTIVEKADLWRYMVVYHHGGFYLDLDCEILPGLAIALRRLDRPLVQIERDGWLEVARGICQLPEFGQFFFAFPPRSPLLLEVLEEVVRRVAERPYRHLGELQQVLFHTGPGAFGAVLGPHRAALRLFRPGSLVRHLCAGSWTKGRGWGPGRLLIRKYRIDYEVLE